jgi:hypothetical protein
MNSARFPIDGRHFLNLVISLQHIVLVNTQSVNPEGTIFDGGAEHLPVPLRDWG